MDILQYRYCCCKQFILKEGTISLSVFLYIYFCICLYLSPCLCIATVAVYIFEIGALTLSFSLYLFLYLSLPLSLSLYSYCCRIHIWNRCSLHVFLSISIFVSISATNQEKRKKQLTNLARIRDIWSISIFLHFSHLEVFLISNSTDL